MTLPVDAVPVATGPSPLEAVPEMRATAKWIVVAAAGTGSLLLGGGPLVAIGKVESGAAAVGAVLGLAIALAGVGWTISCTAEALTPPITTLATLAEPQFAALRERIDRDPAPFFGGFGRTADELRASAALHAKVATNLASALARETDPGRRQVLDRALADANANADLARQLLRRLLELIHAWQVRHALRRARRATIAAIGIVAVGAVVFLLSTGTPAAKGTVPGPGNTVPGTGNTVPAPHSTVPAPAGTVVSP